MERAGFALGHVVVRVVHTVKVNFAGAGVGVHALNKGARATLVNLIQVEAKAAVFVTHELAIAVDELLVRMQGKGALGVVMTLMTVEVPLCARLDGAGCKNPARAVVLLNERRIGRKERAGRRIDVQLPRIHHVEEDVLEDYFVNATVVRAVPGRATVNGIRLGVNYWFLRVAVVGVDGELGDGHLLSFGGIIVNVEYDGLTGQFVYFQTTHVTDGRHNARGVYQYGGVIGETRRIERIVIRRSHRRQVIGCLAIHGTRSGVRSA